MESRFEELYKQQDIFLKLLGTIEQHCFLGGGTALQRFHFGGKFRFSEDLDFFFTTNYNDTHFKYILNALSAHKIPYQITNNATNFKQIRLFDSLKIEFMQDISNTKINDLTPLKPYNVPIDSIENILSNKFECIYSRDEPRDCFDIFTILTQTQTNINAAFDKLIARTNILPEEVVARLLHCPQSFLKRDKILVCNEDIYKDFICHYQEVFAKCGFVSKKRQKKNKIDF